jgi:hypothetical protein
VFRSTQGLQARWRISAAAAAAAAVTAVGLTACAASGGVPAATPTTTVTQTAQASPAPAASNPTAPGAPASSGTLPEYKPSTFLSSESATTVRLSPDSVDKVAAFYETALKSGGWQWHATAKSRWSAHFEAAKGNAHAVIQVSSTGKGASIAVTIIN